MPADCSSPTRGSFWAYPRVCLHGTKPGQLWGNSSPVGNMIHEEGTAEPSVGVARDAECPGSSGHGPWEPREVRAEVRLHRDAGPAQGCSRARGSRPLLSERASRLQSGRPSGSSLLIL